MVGKASLIVIIGFAMIFSVGGLFWGRTSNSAVDNFVDYYNQTAAKNLAEDGANLACNSIRVNVADTSMHLIINDGSNTCEVTSRQRIVAGRRDCFITSVSTNNEGREPIISKVEVWLQPVFLNGFAMFTQDENGVYWVTGDVVTGPFATNGPMFIDGAPIFRGRATAVGGIRTGSAGNHAQFLGGFESGSNVYVDIPKDLSATAAGATAHSTFQPNSSYTGSDYTYDVYLTFNSDGTVTATTKTQQYIPGRRGRAGTWTTVSSTPAVTDTLSKMVNADGETVILVNNGDAHVQGVVSGSVTVVALAGSGASADRSSSTQDVKSGYSTYFNSGTAGNVIVDGNIVYKDRSQTSTDMLGLVADNSVALSAQPSRADVNIDAAIFAKNGSWTYMDFTGLTTGGDMGKLNVTGSICQNLRGAVGTESGGTINTGFLKNYIFDQRFVNAAPPRFPAAVGQYQLVSWYE